MGVSECGEKVLVFQCSKWNHFSDDGFWELDDDGVLVGEGGVSHIFSPRDDYTDFEARARMKISDGGNSGFYFRTKFGGGWPSGYEAQVNSTFPDPQKTGSLYSIAPIRASLVAPDTWFDYGVRCVDTDAGTHIMITINGVVVSSTAEARELIASTPASASIKLHVVRRCPRPPHEHDHESSPRHRPLPHPHTHSTPARGPTR